MEPLVPKRLKRARENALRHFRYPTPLTFVHGVEGEAPAEPRHQLIRLISHRAAIAVCRRICAGKYDRKIGKVTDLVFRLAEPYPDAAGLYVEHGGGQPNEFIPWDKVIKIEDDAIFVNRTDGGARYPPFVDQKGWLLLNDHLMGRTILDMDGRRTEVVNDIQLFYSKGRMIHRPRRHLLQRLPAQMGTRPADISSSRGATSSPSRSRMPPAPTSFRSPSPATRSRSCPARTWPTPSRSCRAKSSRPFSPPLIPRRPPRSSSRPSPGPSISLSPMCAARRPAPFSPKCRWRSWLIFS